MLGVANGLPLRRPDLVIRPLGDDGKYVVKDLCTGAYFTFGEQEHFLLNQLDGVHDAEDICKTFHERFGEPLSENDLSSFVELARRKDLLRPTDEAAAETEQRPASALPVTRPRQSILYWRTRVFDPDRLFTWLAPRLWFLWTRTFVVLSLIPILAAGVLAWYNRGELVSSFANALRWETVALVWLTLFIATTLHEFAHGLTCKHYGGNVHEVGFLLMFFMPCFYCNVSDAWLIREKSRRMWVTLAGGYFDLCAWALAIFIWRLALPDSLLNYVAWVVLSVLSARVFFNFNPLLKLDGYYLLSDWAAIPNLQQRGWDRAKAHFRWLLWGAPRPAAIPRGTFLTIYGMASWFFALFFLGIMLFGLARFLWSYSAVLALAIVTPLGFVTMRGVLTGLGNGEMRRMIVIRRKRTVWSVVLLFAAITALALFHTADQVSGPFLVRSSVRAELRSPVAAFLRDVRFDEGERVSAGTVIACLEIPELPSRIDQKNAEAREAKARLRLLEAGPRAEELDEQRRRVERATQWREQAQQDLAKAGKCLSEELSRLEELIQQHIAEQRFAQQSYDRIIGLRLKSGAAEEQVQENYKKLEVCRAQLEQARAQKRSLETAGTRDAETELARRTKDLADAEGTLSLMQLGTRAEEIEATRAHLARIEEEARYLKNLHQKLPITSPVGGLITTARLKERVGQYLREGELICNVEEPTALVVEISLGEQEVTRVLPDQPAEFKFRALPFETFQGRVVRIAPNATRESNANQFAPAPPPAEVLGRVTVYCQLDGATPEIRPGMSGYARIRAGQRSAGEILLDRVFRTLRTEFWW